MRSRVDERFGTSLHSEIHEIRERMFRRHNINVPEDDPIFAAYEVQNEFIARCNEMGEQLVRQANHQLEDTLRRATDKIEDRARRAFERVGQQLRSEMSPQRIAQEMCKETGDDLREYARSVSRSVRTSLLVIGAASLFVSALVFTLGVQRLDAAERKLKQVEALMAPQTLPQHGPPPMPPSMVHDPKPNLPKNR